MQEITLNFSPQSLTLLNVVLGVVMFGIAIDLRVADFKRVLQLPRAVFAGLCAQFLALPAATFVLIQILRPAPEFALGMLLVSSCPGGNISNFITHRAGGNAALSVSMTAFATVGAIALTPANIALWGNLYEPTRKILESTFIDPVSVAITVAFMLILPLCLGIALNTWRPKISAKIRKPMQWLSMAIFVAFIVIALAANWTFFLNYAGMVAAFVYLHNALALGGGYTLARLTGLSKQTMSEVFRDLEDGGWVQLALKRGAKAVVGVDLLMIEPIPGAELIQADFTHAGVDQQLIDALGGAPDLVLSDMAHNTIGHRQTDHLKIIALIEIAADFALRTLKPGGHFVTKNFQGGDAGGVLAELRANFRDVKYIKPASSRKDSSEVYLVALGRLGDGAA